MAGGVALSCSANGVLVSSGLFDNYNFQPASADDGVSLGAALEACARDRIAHDRPPRNDRMEHACWGPSYDDTAVAAALRAAGLPSRRLAPEALVEAAAGLLDSGRIVGWFQGRAELGPRALGARSIPADPRDRSVVPRLNQIKGREVWRPLASSVKAEHFDEYFDSPFASPFMNGAAPATWTPWYSVTTWSRSNPPHRTVTDAERRWTGRGREGQGGAGRRIGSAAPRRDTTPGRRSS